MKGVRPRRAECRAAPKPARIPPGDRPLHPSARGRHVRGFTLVEVLVALLMMAILAGLAWQGLSGILRARDGSRQSIERTVRLATVLTQWEQDLQSLYDTQVVPPLSFDGQTLRLTRRAPAGGVALVAWAVRGGVLQRWAGPVVTRTGQLQEGWLRSQQLLGNEPGQLTVAEGASTWQLYYSRGGQWSNAQSTGDLATPIVAAAPTPSASQPGGSASSPPTALAPPATIRDALPDAVRLVITLNGQQLTRDIALGPAGS